MSLTKIDPTWAWTPYRPSESQPWNRIRAAHLFRRAGFGATSQELDAAVGRDPDEIVAGLVTPNLDAEFESESDAFATTILASGNPKQLSAWWSYVMLRTPHPLLEKTTLFWHGHFASGDEKVQDVLGRLEKEAHQMAEKLYTAAAGGAAPDAGSNGAPSGDAGSDGKKGDVIDAEFEETN